jgi:hypothetical protein
MNTLSRFSQFALTRGEMKSVSGGTCHARCLNIGSNGYWDGTGSELYSGTAKGAKNAASDCGSGARGYYCCKQCNSVSWM